MPRLLVRATNWLGDAVMSIPALRELRRGHPGWRMTILARPWVAELYAREDFCDDVVLYRRDGVHGGWLGRERLARELRAGRFDRAVLLQNAFDAAWLAWRAGIPERIGYARDGRGPLLTGRARRPAPGEIPPHQRFYYLELLRRTGLLAELPASADIRLQGIAELARRGAAQWERRGLPGGPWIGVSPGAAFGTAKRWPSERFAAAARELADSERARIAVFGSPAEAAVAARTAALAGDRAHCLAGETTLAEYLELAASCSLYLTNDSGSMHAAAAAGVPTVAVFGATDPEATGPAATWARIVREPVACSPCQLRECPVAGHPCMAGVGVERVVEAARGLLAARGTGPGARQPPVE